MANMGPVADRRGPVRFPLMGTAIVTGSGGLIGSESVRPSGRAGIRRGRNRERHAQPVLRPRGLDLAGDRSELTSSLPDAFRSHERRHPRRRRRSSGSSPSTPARSRSSSTPPPSRRTTGPRASRRPTSASTPTAPSTCSRPRAPHCPDAPFIFCSTNKVYGDTPEPAAAARTWRRGSSCPSRTTTSRASTPRCRSTSRPTRCSASRRRPPTCWCRSTAATSRCRRSAFRGGCLTGPQHAGAKLHGFLAYLMKCVVTGTPVHRLRLRGQAGPRQHPQRRPGRRLRRLPRGAARRRRSTTSAAAASRNCSMLEAIEACERIAGRELEWEMGRGAADRRPPLVDLRPRARSRPTTRTGRCATGSTTSSREMYEQNLERWEAAVA